ncbi:type 11 methyltransferase [Natrialba chahannaoensis JCM 10990]|uniref:Type 11 methyltransferase n=1 Tax=Natrialba chahannaoensis JCM 10990 TaxID=1227492 RepID=M0A8U8_9EURY|nr:class I SAM-dependent methyltransferase [Natrialba chahannaoensis]ELY94949.1 type 11 methyltransferase [Natrialba chahannaoensis JCM 10990]
MGFHTFDPERAPALEDASRYRWCSREELLSLLEPCDKHVVADLGSGTGFFADDVAPYVDTLYAIDVQAEMHEFYREKGLPENVDTLHANTDDLPLADDSLDAAFSVDTYHEFASDDSLSELARVLKPGGRLVTVDWSATGEQASGPPLTERFALGDAVSQLQDAGFSIRRATDRLETYTCVAHAPDR